MHVGEIILLAVAAATVGAALAPFSRSKKWWIRGWEFPRLQLAFVSAAAFAAAAVSLDVRRPVAMAGMAVLAATFAWQAYRILPYTLLWRRESKGAVGGARGERLSLLISNVLMTNRDSAPLLDLIARHDPDVVLTIESDAWWGEKLEAQARGRPHKVLHPLDNTYGMHLFSRRPLHDVRSKCLIEDDVPSIHARLELLSGERVYLHCLHPSPPSPTQHEESRERDAELSIVARACARRDAPAIVIGDLNDVAWSRTTRAFRRVSSLRDPRRGRGMFNTYHAGIPIMRWPLDHVFHSDHFALARLERLPSIGSDHFPMLAELERTAAWTRVGSRHSSLRAGREHGRPGGR